MDNLIQQLGTNGLVITVLLMGAGFFVKHMVDELKELKSELRNDIHDIRGELRHLNNRVDSMSLDVADMKPKVNSLWEHFVTTNNKPL